MRILTLLVAVFLGAAYFPSVQAQTMIPAWKVVPNAPVASPGIENGDRFEDVEFIDPDNGYMVYFRGEIWRTTDGGESWGLNYENSDVLFRSLGFTPNGGPSGVTGWAGSLTPGPDVLWEKRNGGSWIPIGNRISGDQPTGICGLWVVNDLVAYGVGRYNGNPVVIKTSDGGLSWTGKRISNVTATLIDVYFRNENEGFAIGGTGQSLNGDAVVLRTTDGGNTWNQVHRQPRQATTTGEWGWKIVFPSDLVGYVAVEYAGSSGPGTPARVLKTVDGGLTWNALSIPGSTAERSLQGIGFINENVGWASGRGVTSFTQDGGATWEQLISYSPNTGQGQLDGNMNRFQVLNDTLAYAVGKRLYRLTGTDFTDTAIDERPVIPKAYTLSAGYPNPFTESMKVDYTLYEPGRIKVTITDMLGRVVREYPESHDPPGAYSFEWDGRDAQGRKLASGNYVLLMDIGNAMETKQVVRIE